MASCISWVMITRPRIRRGGWKRSSAICWPPWASPIPTPKETMSSTADDGRPGPRAARGRGPWGALLSWIKARRRGDGRARRDGAAQSQAAADLMDHAEAFQSLRVADVMTPRADITAVDLSSSFEALVGAFADSEHSRLPVYRETLDDPVGVAHLKDVFKPVSYI